MLLFWNKTFRFWDFYELVSSNIKEFVSQLNNPHHSLSFIPFPSVFSDSQWQPFPKCFWCGNTLLLNLISLLQIHWYSLSHFRATFLGRVRLKQADTSPRVVSAAAHLGIHLGSWDKLKKHICRKHCCGKLWLMQLGCALLVEETCVPLLFVPWKDLDFFKRKKYFTVMLQGELTMLGWTN